jgi:hypothetical protein
MLLACKLIVIFCEKFGRASRFETSYWRGFRPNRAIADGKKT